MRAPNEIDFWRGFALATIFINHVPGIFYERFTHRNVSLSDSAELFVFLAGWSLRYVVSDPGQPVPAFRLVLRLVGRAVVIYAAQMLITVLAIALIAAAALYFEAPPILEWHNASAVFEEPVATHIGLVLLSHQLGYFNILPLYVVLMTAAPAIALLDRVSPWLLLAASVALYVCALLGGLNLPTWPVEGRWFLDPLTWQFIFVLGFLIAAPGRGLGASVRRHRPALRILAVPFVIAGGLAAWFHYSPDPLRVPDPKLFFMFDKTFLSPARLVHSIALVGLFAGSYRYIAQALPPVARYMSMLGRNSLNVFCVGSVLSLCGQIGRFEYGGGIGTDTVVILMGIVALGVTGWVSEWRDRLRARQGPQPSPSSPPQVSSPPVSSRQAQTT
ncbi:MAG: OpgC domain-containing protein [Methylobacteriaceae bacterium]|nr:OpgC domain-containing protein [Methylobacteriaceae bacterium]